MELLENKNINPSVVKILEASPSKEQLQDVLKKLNMKASQLFDGKISIELKLSQIDDENELIDIMVKNPILIGPIIIKVITAVIARPIENFK